MAFYLIPRIKLLGGEPVRYTHGDWNIRVLHCWLWMKQEKTYRGSSTVWYSLPDVKRAGTDMEYILSNFHKKLKWEREASY